MQIFLRATQTNAPAAHLLYLCLSDTNPQGVLGEDIDHSIVYGGRKQEAKCPLMGNRYITGGRWTLWDSPQELETTNQLCTQVYG